MSEKPISDLRRRMLEDMAVRRFGEKTRHDYIRHVEAFARFLGRSPDTATAEDVRRFQVHLTESGVQPPTLNGSASALRFFFGITLDRAELARHLARVHYPRKLPRVLSPEEVGRLLEAAPGPGLKYKAALSIAYGAGLAFVRWAADGSEPGERRRMAVEHVTRPQSRGWAHRRDHFP
jgi:site-specific recombinase XerD